MEQKTGGVKQNELDITQQVNVSDPACVLFEIKSIFEKLYPEEDLVLLDTAFYYFAQCYAGQHPDYHACETPYHNIQHVLDVTLATARLIDGYEKKHTKNCLGSKRAMLGMVVALFHDSGYLRYSSDFESSHGAEYTKIHVSRSGYFIKRFLMEHGLPEWVDQALVLVQYTGLEFEIEDLGFEDALYIQLGYLIGTADIIAQMADKDYIEKCEAHLYDEFLLGGLTHREHEDGSIEVLYASAQDLLIKTPAFINDAITNRLGKSFDKAYEYATVHFGGRNLYMESIEKNIAHAHEKIANIEI